MFRSAISPVTA